MQWAMVVVGGDVVGGWRGKAIGGGNIK